MQLNSTFPLIRKNSY